MTGTHGGPGWPSGADSRDSLPPPYSLTDGGGVQNADTCFCADSRESSSQSLVPSTFGDSDPYRGRRRLLIVYIHGFYGNDQSFRSFPAHVHGYVKSAVQDTHVVHSKIYPRYKTYKSIDIAVANFSAWLQPHENPDTDVVLVGHSMGGILAAEVVLLANKSPYSSQLLKHRILGTISMDCPFLGLHPGIIVSGISSLFRPAAGPAAAEPATPPPGELSSTALSPVTTTNSTVESVDLSQIESTTSVGSGQTSLLSTMQSSISQPPTPDTDPFFNPPFFNDNSFKERPFKQRLVHFVKKHSSEGVFGAAKNHVLSHLEYGGCLADYAGLHNRYNKIRALENVDELKALHRQHHEHGSSGGGRVASRVRFVNYYTISTGIPKKDKPPPARSPAERSPSRSPSRSPTEEREMVLLEPIPEPQSPERPSTPAIQIDSPGDAKNEAMALGEDIKPVESSTSADEEKSGLQNSAFQSMDGSSNDVAGDGHPAASQSDLGLAFPSSEEALDLPAIPEAPVKPTPPDLDRFTSEDARRQAEKEAKREQKSYDQAVKNRDKTIKERQNMIDKRRKKLEKERAKQQKEAEKLKAKQEKEAEKLRAKQEKEKQKQTPEPSTQTEAQPETGSAGDAPDTATTEGTNALHLDGSNDASQRPMAASDSNLPIELEAERVEAAKPPRERKFCVLPRRSDDTWVRVFMADVDEVGAHCGLFVPGAPHYDVLVGDVGHRILEWVQEHLSKEAILQLARETDELELD